MLPKLEGEVAVDFPSVEADDQEEVGLHEGAVVHEGEEDLPPEEEGALEVASPEGEVDQFAQSWGEGVWVVDGGSLVVVAAVDGVGACEGEAASEQIPLEAAGVESEGVGPWVEPYGAGPSVA